MALTGWQLMFGGAVLLALSILLETQRTIEWSIDFVVILGFLAFGGTSLAVFLWYWCLQQAEAAKLGVWLFLVPALGVLLSVVWLGERLQGFQVFGVMLIFASVGFTNLKNGGKESDS